MELSYSNTINVPQGFAFERATDFERFEAEGFGNLAPFEPRNEIRAPKIGATLAHGGRVSGAAPAVFAAIAGAGSPGHDGAGE